ncbi:MAG TPA: F0F1 ATP synthase subunit A [Candidatus Kapabacteria bacterium]|nr:F0F1 ATP synthase subunit A [Candidatus Kapabacteria bacterium]
MNSESQQPTQLLADASTHSAPSTAKDKGHSTEHPAEHKEMDSTHAGAHGAGEGAEGGGLFTELISHLDDTHELHFFNAHVPLPYLFWDQDGFHTYGSTHAVEESAIHTVGAHGKALRKDGQPISLDMSITANVVFLFLAGLLMFWAGRAAAKQTKKSMVPKGIGNVMESLVLFVRDELVLPNIDKKYATPLVPFFVSIFMFILVLNFLGLIPFGRSATGALGVTAALALFTFFITQYVAFKSMGLVGFLKHLTGGIIDMDLNIFMKVLLILIMIPIEVIGLFTKPFALAMRLFANMTAGHIIIVSLIGLAIMWQSVVAGFAVSVPFALFIMVLEILVAFIQAYVFTMLSALFIGMAVHEHHDEEGHPAAGHEHGEHHGEMTPATASHGV